MITISVGCGFLIYVGALLAALSGAVVYELWRSSLHDWRISEEQLARCSECGLTFVVSRSEKVARCPRCNALCPIRRR